MRNAPKWGNDGLYNYYGLLFSFYSALQWGNGLHYNYRVPLFTVRQKKEMTDLTIIITTFLICTVHHNEQMTAFSIKMGPFLQCAVIATFLPCFPTWGGGEEEGFLGLVVGNRHKTIFGSGGAKCWCFAVVSFLSLGSSSSNHTIGRVSFYSILPPGQHTKKPSR